MSNEYSEGMKDDKIESPLWNVENILADAEIQNTYNVGSRRLL